MLGRYLNGATNKGKMYNMARKSSSVEIRTRIMENRDNEHGEGGREERNASKALER